MSGRRLLPQQEAAVTRPGSVGLSAGAGCGKTFVLIERFLHELDPARRDGPGPHGLASVAAITFTDKAAREMRDRLREKIADRLRDGDRRDQRAHWRDLLRRADAARISTIHGFCAELLRGHAAQAGVDPAFAVVVGADEDELKAAAVDDALKRSLARDPAGGVHPAHELVTAYGLDRVKGLVASLAFGDPDTLAREWDLRRLVGARAAAWETEQVPRMIEQFGSLPERAETVDLLRACPAEKPAHAEARRELAGLLDAVAAGTPPPDAFARIDAIGRLPKVGGKGCWPDDDVKDRVGKLLGTLRDGAKALAADADPDPAGWDEPARLGLAFLPLARDAAERYADAKRAGAQLDNQDLLRRGRDLLGDPAVRGLVAGQLRLLMVDEFQDTDPVQAELVARLTSLSESTVTAGPADAGRLFLVGDAKQSIYRFRGADPAVFGRVRGALPKSAQLPLTKNFRSRPELLRFVNALFVDALPDYEALEPPPAEVRPAVPAAAPCVEFLFPTVTPPEWAKASAEDLRREEAAWVAARVRHLIDSREPCVRADGGERPATPGDFCLLFRALSDVRLYEEALRDVGLEYYLTGGQAFFAQQEVHDLAHLLLWLDDPDDTLSLAGALRSPLFSLSDDTLFALRHAGGTDDSLHPLAAAVLGDGPVRLDEPQAERLAHCRAVLRELVAGRDRLSPGDLLDLAVSRTGYDAAVSAEFLGDRKLANLRKLQALARGQTRGDAGPGLRGFAARLLESVERETKEELAATRAEAADVVRLMTVHKAKGLEFPIVVVCDLDRKPNAESVAGVCDAVLGPVVPMPKQLGQEIPDLCGTLVKDRETALSREEEVRVFYVAATRAADRLILSSGRAADVEPKGVGLATLAAAFDLATGEPHADSSDAPPVLIHREKPAAVAAKAGKKKSVGIPIERADAAVAGCEPSRPFDLRRPLPAAVPGAIDARLFTYESATDDEREELDAAAAFLRDGDGGELRGHFPPDLGPPVARRVAVRVPGIAGGPAVVTAIPRVHRRGAGWYAAGTAAATAAEVAGDDLPDRLVPLAWAWRRSLDAAGGGDAAVLLVAPCGAARLAAWDGRADTAVAAILAGAGGR